MKRFIVKFITFCVCLFLIDITIGIIFNYIHANAKGGATYRDRYICDELECDLLLVGSSRCEHHYNPIILQDSLKMSCYNAGQSGNGIIVAYARYLMMCERKEPELVIYDINPDFDLLDGYDNHRYLTWLKSYYDKSFVRPIFEEIDQTEKYKMTSQMYRYNSRFLEMLIDYVYPVEEPNILGYSPCHSEMDRTKIDSKEMNKHLQNYRFDSVKLNYIRKFIDTVGKDSIVICISPRWYGLDEGSYKPVVDICKEKGVRFINFSNDPKYVYNDIFFKDGTHLNAKGADEFTRDLIKKISSN